jgi:hypothetical protein
MFGDAPLPADGSTATPTWAGAAQVERLVVVGTPNAGSLNAVFNLVDGARFGPIASYSPAVLGSMPAVYELLPRGRHQPLVDAGGEVINDLYEAAVWQRFGWGLASPRQDKTLAWLLPETPDPAERREHARATQARLLANARQFAAALDQAASPPPGTTLHLFAADSEPTASRAQATRDGRIRAIEFAPGDGTVLRSSALLDERVGGAWTPALLTPIHWTDVTFLFADHLGMTRSAAFSDNVLFRLLER